MDRDFDGAIGTLKTIFAISRHMGEHPTIISGLVGVAVAQIGCNLLEELIQQPGAPNLYWALTGLPPQLVDMRKAASADRSMWSYGMFDKTRVWTADYMRAITQQLGLVEGAFGVRLLASMLELPAEDKAAAEKWVQARTADAEWLTAARKGLTDAGYPADAVARYPPQQVIIHDLLRKAKAHGDEMLKWVPVPYWQAEPAMSELVKAPAEIEDKLAQQFVASIPKVKAAHARLEQRLDMLRIAEAVRLEAAKNGGKLPVRSKRPERSGSDRSRVRQGVRVQGGRDHRHSGGQGGSHRDRRDALPVRDSVAEVTRLAATRQRSALRGRGNDSRATQRRARLRERRERPEWQRPIAIRALPALDATGLTVADRLAHRGRQARAPLSRRG